MAPSADDFVVDGHFYIYYVSRTGQSRANLHRSNSSAWEQLSSLPHTLISGLRYQLLPRDRGTTCRLILINSK